MAGCRSGALEEPGAGRGVEDPRRQCHIARTTHSIAPADQHRNQHEEPEHDKRYPEEGLGDARHDACSFPHQARSVTSASVDGAPRQLHTCNSPETSTNSHICHICHTLLKLSTVRCRSRRAGSVDKSGQPADVVGRHRQAPATGDELTWPLRGSDAVDRGLLSVQALRRFYVPAWPGLHIPRGAELSAVQRAEAAYLW